MRVCVFSSQYIAAKLDISRRTSEIRLFWGIMRDEMVGVDLCQLLHGGYEKNDSVSKKLPTTGSSIVRNGTA